MDWREQRQDTGLKRLRWLRRAVELDVGVEKIRPV